MNLWRGIRTITHVAIGLLILGTPTRGVAGQLEGDTQPKLSGTALVKELNVVLAFVLIAAAVAVGWSVGQLVTRKVGLGA